MISYSIRHDQYYDRMAEEMLRYGDFKGAIAAQLANVRRFAGCINAETSNWMDDLYDDYGDRSLIE